ncbi:MAG: ABC transporter permease [Actinomycetota bacterium]|nr:ABC transporter permease [Actinomycetota bacterium]
MPSLTRSPADAVESVVVPSPIDEDRDSGGQGSGSRRQSAWAVLASYVVIVFFLVTLNFFLPRALPGKPIQALSNPQSTTYVGYTPTRSAVERYYGLDRPLLTQYFDYLKGLAHGNLGTSIEYNTPVTSVLLSRLPWTLLLIGTSLILATAIGMLAGIRSGWRRGSREDRRLIALFVATDNFPAFFLAFVVLYVFVIKLGWFPLAGAQTPFSGSFGLLHKVTDVAYHLVLPAGVLVLQFTAYQYLVMRASMVGELGSDYMLLGRAKGLSDHVLKYRYAARNALLPAITVATLQIGWSVVAAIFIETVFNYPGIGRLMFDSIGVRDYPTLQGCFLMLSLLVVTANRLADLLYRRLDPRIAA